MQVASPTDRAATLEPHLGYGGGQSSSNRYPNPFFDLAQEYMPRTVKELHRWCSYFFYSDPIINSTVTKVSRYPITDMILEDPDTRVKEFWGTIFNDYLHIKDRNMETNLDLNVYGNAFTSLSFPFIRYLICQNCKNRENVKDVAWTWSSYTFHWNCPKCKSSQVADPEKPETLKDVPYKAAKHIKLVRWNPENIGIRYNEATAERHYFYNVSRNIRFQLQNGEKEIIEGLPLLFIIAVKRQRLVKISPDNIFHLKRPTLAEKDMGWGKPLIQPVLKDLYYKAVLRRAQEAIANEHIVPFDFLFPQPNAQMDPFVHSDLGNWRMKVEQALANRKRDPNYKAVLPVPIGFGRLGGDGKAMLLTPELNLINQQTTGGMGIPVEFLFGGLSWSGSSITLRSLQNDFQHNQTQLLEENIWIKNKIRTYLQAPDLKSMRFMDFKMADDIQRIQQMISLNAAKKLSDETLLTELGLDYEKETKKMVQELNVQNEIQEVMMKAQARISGEAQLISYEYQSQLQELQMQDQQKAQMMGMGQPGQEAQPGQDRSGQDQQAQSQGQQDYAQPPQGQPGQQPGQPGQDQGQGNVLNMDVAKTALTWAKKLTKVPPADAQQQLMQTKQQMPAFGKMVEEEYNKLTVGSNPEINMSPLPENGAPRRKGSY